MQTRYRQFSAIGLVVALLCSDPILASHYRGGFVNWRHVNGRTIEYTANTSWRVGSVGSPLFMATGADSHSSSSEIVYTDAVYETRETKGLVTYNSDGNYDLVWDSCCRIGLLTHNSEGEFSLRSDVDINDGNSSPMAYIPPLVDVPPSTAWTYDIPYIDPDGDTVTFSLADQDDVAAGTTFTQPSGLAVSSGGQISWSTPSNVGDLYTVGIVVTDGTSSTTLDVLLQISNTATNDPPSITGPGSSTIQVYIGQENDILFTGSDPEGTDLTWTALETIPNLTEVLAADGSTNTVTFTPDATQSGRSYSLIYMIEDEDQNRAFAAVTLQVLEAPQITTTPGPNGAINPSGVVSVVPLTNQTFTIDPAFGAYVSDVLVDSVSIGSVSDYTFVNVTENHTISATFGVFPSITATSGPNGSLSEEGVIPVGVTANILLGNGENKTFNISASPNYQVADVMVDDVSQGAIASYTFNNVLSDHTIRATFEAITVPVTATSTGSVTVSPSGVTLYQQNVESPVFRIIVTSNGYQLQDVFVNGISQGPVESVVIPNISAATTIHAIAVPKPQIDPLFHSTSF